MFNSNDDVLYEINIPALAQTLLVFLTLLVTSHFLTQHCEPKHNASVDDNCRKQENDSSNKTKKRVRFDLTQPQYDPMRAYNPEVHLKSFIPIFILYQKTLLRRLEFSHYDDTLSRLITRNAFKTLSCRIINNPDNQFNHKPLTKQRYHQLLKHEVDETLIRLASIRAIIQTELKKYAQHKQDRNVKSQPEPYQYHHIFNHVNNHVLQHWDLYREQTQSDDTKCKIASLTLQAVVLGS